MRLYDVLVAVSQYPWINAGGCGIAALTIGRWVRKQYHAEVKYVLLYMPDDIEEQYDYLANESELQHGNPPRVVPMHIAVIYKGYMLDCDGIIDADLLKQEVTEDKLVALVNVKDGWNSMFKRSYYTPRIAKRIGVDLSDVKL